MSEAQSHPTVGVRQFFGLSRMTHSVLDVAHPAVGGALAAVVLGEPRPREPSSWGCSPRSPATPPSLP